VLYEAFRQRRAKNLRAEGAAAAPQASKPRKQKGLGS
jgi:hypothetical protein